MNDLSDVTVGTELFVTRGYQQNWIEKVERITPTGRVITKTGTYDRDGYLRGERNYWTQARARIATKDDIAGIYRLGLVSKLKGVDWNKLSADDLKAVSEITSKY